MKLRKYFLSLIVFSSCILALCGCERETASEQAGEDIEEATEEVGGQVEEAGEKIEEATDH